MRLESAQKPSFSNDGLQALHRGLQQGTPHRGASDDTGGVDSLDVRLSAGRTPGSCCNKGTDSSRRFATMTADDLIHTRPHGTRATILRILWLGAPVPLFVLVIGLLSLFPDADRLPGESLIAFGLLAILAGGIPIFRHALSPAAKALLFGMYFCACAVGMFVFGWAALGIFSVKGN
jgi:hypothetical protein